MAMGQDFFLFFFLDCFGLFLSLSFRHCTVVIHLPPTLHNISSFFGWSRFDVSRKGGTRAVRLNKPRVAEFVTHTSEGKNYLQCNPVSFLTVLPDDSFGFLN